MVSGIGNTGGWDRGIEKRGGVMATKLDKYKPSGKKLLMAKCLADPEFQGTITDHCANVGV